MAVETFKARDRVRGKISWRMGTVSSVGDYGERVNVLWDGAPSDSSELPGNLEWCGVLLQNESQPADAKPAHREMRHWDLSYTKTVYDDLERYGHTSNFGVVRSAVRDALNLLKQYHQDLHIPYEQRDQARREVKDLQSLVAKLIKQRDAARAEATEAKAAHVKVTQRIIEKDAALVKLRSRIQKALAALTVYDPPEIEVSKQHLHATGINQAQMAKQDEAGLAETVATVRAARNLGSTSY